MSSVSSGRLVSPRLSASFPSPPLTSNMSRAAFASYRRSTTARPSKSSSSPPRRPTSLRQESFSDWLDDKVQPKVVRFHKIGRSGCFSGSAGLWKPILWRRSQVCGQSSAGLVPQLKGQPLQRSKKSPCSSLNFQVGEVLMRFILQGAVQAQPYQRHGSLLSACRGI